MKIEHLLRTVVNNQASDLHLSTGLPPMQRLHGEMLRLEHPVLAPDHLSQMLRDVMTDEQITRLAQTLECDFSLDFLGLGRFRVNVFHRSRGLSAVFRIIPSKIPTLEKLKAPLILKDIAQNAHG